MEKMTVVNGETPANAYFMNKLQDNVEDAINETIKTSKTVTHTSGYSCNYINECNTYSINETLTGKTWIDGKPIYRKVLSYSNSYTNTGSRKITHNLGVDNYTNIVYGSLNYAGMTFPIPRIANDGNNVGISSISSNSLIIDVATAITSYSNLILVLEYTKTTDT